MERWGTWFIEGYFFALETAGEGNQLEEPAFVAG